jgi:hypothetical protein
MLSQLERLTVDAEGRYATDNELRFLQTYLATARLRFRLYQKIQQLEVQIVREVLQRLQAEDPTLLQAGGQDLTAKWQRDTVRTLRHAAAALLVNDEDLFREGMLLWFQTIMRSFRAERSCEATYRIMQAVVKRHFTVEEADLLCPILELSRATFANAG